MQKRNLQEYRVIAILFLLTFLAITPRSAEARLAPYGIWYDRLAVVKECFYALRRENDGSSSVFIGGKAVSNWNYLANDMDAYGRMKAFYKGCSSSFWISGDTSSTTDFCAPWYPQKSPSYYRDLTWYGLQYSSSAGPTKFVGRGGQCKHFADLILWRSEAADRIDDKHCLPNYAGMVANPAWIRLAKPGDVIFNNIGDGHVAIVVELKTPPFLTPGLDVIDSNFIDGAGQEIIGRHVMSWKDLEDKKYQIFAGTRYFGTDYHPY